MKQCKDHRVTRCAARYSYTLPASAEYIFEEFTRVCKGLQGCTRVYRGLQGYTRVYRGKQGISGVYKGSHGLLGVYKGLQGLIGVCKGLQGLIGTCKGLQGVIGVYKGLQGLIGVYKGLQGYTRVFTLPYKGFTIVYMGAHTSYATLSRCIPWNVPRVVICIKACAYQVTHGIFNGTMLRGVS